MILTKRVRWVWLVWWRMDDTRVKGRQRMRSEQTNNCWFWCQDKAKHGSWAMVMMMFVKHCIVKRRIYCHLSVIDNLSNVYILNIQRHLVHFLPFTLCIYCLIDLFNIFFPCQHLFSISLSSVTCVACFYIFSRAKCKTTTWASLFIPEMVLKLKLNVKKIFYPNSFT